MSNNARNYGNKTIYVRDWAAWDRAAQHADSLGMSMSDYIALALERMQTPPTAIENKLNMIAEILHDREWKMAK